MENNELKKVCMKNRTCLLFFTGKKIIQKCLIYDVSYKALTGTKPLCIMFDKVDGFVKDYDGTKYLVLFGIEKCNAIYDRIK